MFADTPLRSFPTLLKQPAMRVPFTPSEEYYTPSRCPRGRAARVPLPQRKSLGESELARTPKQVVGMSDRPWRTPSSSARKSAGTAMPASASPSSPVRYVQHASGTGGESHWLVAPLGDPTQLTLRSAAVIFQQRLKERGLVFKKSDPVKMYQQSSQVWKSDSFLTLKHPGRGRSARDPSSNPAVPPGCGYTVFGQRGGPRPKTQSKSPRPASPPKKNGGRAFKTPGEQRRDGLRWSVRMSMASPPH